MTYVGINIGAVSVKVARVGANGDRSAVAAHHGRPLETLDEVLAHDAFRDATWFGVSGHLGRISEVAAVERALRQLDIEFGAVASLGGESFLIYVLDGKRVRTVLSHNKCAAGSGEFFVQQIGRMGLTLEEAVRRSFQGKVVALASRCSVHCKSDITHKLNRGEASVEDILHTLHDGMADKLASLMEKVPGRIGRVLLIGGAVRNEALVAALGAKLPAASIVVLPESTYFEAWGTALLVQDDPQERAPQLTVRPTFTTLPALDSYADRVHVIDPSPVAPAFLRQVDAHVQQVLARHAGSGSRLGAGGRGSRPA